MPAVKLVILESPAKISKFRSILGDGYTFKASIGHIEKLPEKTLAIDLQTFEPQYVLDPKKKKNVDELVAIAKTASEVYLCTDKDNEGEAIAKSLQRRLKLGENYKRIIFTELTKSHIENAFKHPTKINEDKCLAQKSRVVLDRIIGYEGSPILWKHIQGGLSMGRVQSVVLRLIVEKNEEYDSFNAEKYWQVTGSFLHNEAFTVNGILNTNFDDKEGTMTFINDCKNAVFAVANIKQVNRVRKPAPPFSTQSLLQECSNKFGYGPKKVMMIAQKLYEAGHITYHRTDSVNLSESIIQAAKEYITATFGAEYSQSRRFKTKDDSAQEAHEAIRPTHIEHDAAAIKFANSEEERVYDLIWKRTLASQMADAKFRDIVVDISISTRPDDEFFIAKAEELIFDGFMRVYETHKEKDENSDDLAAINAKNTPESFRRIVINDVLEKQEIVAAEKLTNPPANYTEASIIKKMKECGIGRPSTYSSIVDKLFVRNYVVRETRSGGKVKLFTITLNAKNATKETAKETTVAKQTNKLFATDIGKITAKFLCDNFQQIMDVKFTAGMEKNLDNIEAKKLNWNTYLQSFYTLFHPIVETLLAGAVTIKQNLQQKRLLGSYEGAPLVVQKTKFGPVIKQGDGKNAKFYNLPEDSDLSTMTLDDALAHIANAFPRNLGEYEGKTVLLNKGRFGFYIQREGEKNISLKGLDNPETKTLDEIIAFINSDAETPKTGGNSKVLREFSKDCKIINGKYGPCILYKSKFYKITNTDSIDELTENDVKNIVAALSSSTPAKKPARKTTKK